MVTDSEDLPTITKVSVDKLRLDAENPRLSSSLLGEPSQEDLIRVLWTEMAVDEVAISIAENGYYQQEPLLVIEYDGGVTTEGTYTVVEGNRRLAAVLLLRDQKLRQKIKATDLPVIGPRQRSRLDTLPVIVYPSRRSLWAYLGFRHVNGTKPWDAFSKAQYVARVHEQFHVPLREIADRIGDKHWFVKRLYRGYTVLRQAEGEVGFDREDRVRNRFYFSHLYTAVDQAEFQKFLGITEQRLERRDPVPRSRLNELTELLTWLYGKRSQGIEPLVQSQNPDLNMLRNVLGKASSLSLLRSGRTLQSAFEASVGDRRRFREALTLAKDELQEAKATVTTGFHGERDLLEVVGDIVLLANSIEGEMQARSTIESRAMKSR